MQPDPRSLVDEAAAANDIRQAMMNAFCAVLHRSGMPPMTLMRLAALAVGSVYREVAEAHKGQDACPCGWEPLPTADIAVMQDAVAEAAQAQEQLSTDLVWLEPSGSA